MPAPNSGAQQKPEFQPAMRQIASITQSNPVVITTTFDHNYFTGDIVRINIPSKAAVPGNSLAYFGMPEINQKYAAITVTGNTTFTMPIDSTLFQPFSIPAGSLQFPQCTNIGEVAQNIWGAEYNTLPTLIRVDHQPLDG